MNTYEKLANYVEKASNLAEVLRVEVENGAQYPSKVIVAMNEFVVAAHLATNLLDTLHKKNIRLS